MNDYRPIRWWEIVLLVLGTALLVYLGVTLFMVIDQPGGGFGENQGVHATTAPPTTGEVMK